MRTHIALLRAVNVGGTGKLPMADLRSLCEGLGFEEVRTYIQSGNLVFSSGLSAAAAKKELEAALAATLGQRCRVLIRSAAQLRRILESVPFPDAAPDRLIVMFLDRKPPAGAIDDVRIPGRERLALAGRELYIHYPDGIGRSRLVAPFKDEGTGRNLNTLRKLLEMATT